MSFSVRLATLLAALCVPALASAADAPKTPAKAIEGPAVSVVAAATGEVTEQIVVTGTLVAREEVQVTPEIEGLGVSEILVDEGDHVTKGQVLARLNRTSLDVQLAQFAAQLAQADATVAQAKAQVAQAQANRLLNSRALDRANALHSKGFATASTLDQAQATSSVSEAQLESASKSVDSAIASKKAIEAQRDQILWKVSRTEILAPSDGIISQRNVRMGQVGSAAGLPMFRIISGADIELEAEIPDISLPRISKGMAVSAQPAGMTEVVPGTVRLISPEIDKATRLGHVRVALKHDDRLAIGASARGTIEIGRRSGVTLPLSAVSYDKAGAFAQVVKDNLVHTQRLTIGLLGSQTAEVTSGLAAGDLVISRAGTFVRDGDRVRPMSAPAQEATQ
jgi:HlyD family secretion protein